MLARHPAVADVAVLGRPDPAVSGLHYDIVRRVPAPDGVLQQHVLRGQLPNGAEVELHAAMYLQVRPSGPPARLCPAKTPARNI